MDRRILASLAVALVIVTAGCFGASGSGSTATPTATTTRTDAASFSPPGIHNGTVTNASALVAAHHDTLVDAGSFTSNWTQTYGGRTQQTIVHYSTDDGIRWTTERSGGEKIRWAPGLHQYGYALVIKTEGNAVYQRVTSPASVGRVTQAASLDQLVAAFDLQVTGTDTVNGHEVLVVRSTDVTRPKKVLGLWNLGSMQSANLTLKVDERGVIREFDHGVETGGNDIAIHTTFSQVGSTTVRKPDWVGTARQKLRVLGLRANATTDTVRLVFQSGASIPEGSKVFLGTPDRQGQTTFRLNRTLREGTVYYVDVGDTPGITTDRPAATTVRPGTYYLAIQHDGNTIVTAKDRIGGNETGS
ncbi:MAG: hypothetical protein ABEI96_04865 [Haloarculaceae archaeon]